jgi:NAD(P)-dependent dehydrogenase (short-subunit alcohol dehydrogenase family)
MAKQVSLGRVGQPQEIAKTINWLISKSPEYITGALIPVSGAWEY